MCEVRSIKSESIPVSHLEIEYQAFLVWKGKELMRRCEDWFDAVAIVWKRPSHLAGPPDSEIRPVAHKLWLERKDGRARQDWLEGERIANRLRRIAA